MKNVFDQYYDEAVEPGRRERAYAWGLLVFLFRKKVFLKV